MFSLNLFWAIPPKSKEIAIRLSNKEPSPCFPYINSGLGLVIVISPYKTLVINREITIVKSYTSQVICPSVSNVD